MMNKTVREIITQLLITIARYVKSYTGLNQLQFEFLQVGFSAYISYSRVITGRYSREVLYSEKNFEIILIGLEEKLYSPFYDYSKNVCVMKVLKEEIQKVRLFKDKTQSLIILKASVCGYITNLDVVYSIKKGFTENVIFLHPYSLSGYISEKIKF